jgi:hypothetical protein
MFYRIAALTDKSALANLAPCPSMRIVCILFLFFAGLCQCFAQNALGSLFQAAKQLEIRPMIEKPTWAEPETAPLFTVAWLSDLHLTDAASENLVRAACQLIREQLKPDLTFITGDNCGLPESKLHEHPEKSLGWRRHLWLKSFLQEELPGGYVLIPGDNWPWDFEKVFGAEKRSFTMAGFQFIFLTPDQQAVGKEGCLIFAEDTLAWLDEQIKVNQEKPTLLLMHEPIWPPCFLDAPKIRSLANDNAQILGVLGGHIHLDLEFTSKHWKQWCCPAIGRSHNPAFKHLAFHRDQILMTSYEWNSDKGVFAQAQKWQRIEVPEKYREKLPVRRPDTGFAMENLQEMPPRPRQKNQQLAERFSELSSLNMNFILEATFGTMLK